MKISRHSEEISEVIIEAWEDFKIYCQEKNITTFTCESFIGFINSNEDYFLIAYRYYEDKNKLIHESGGKDPVGVFDVMCAFTGENKFYKNDKGQKEIVAKKVAPNKYEFL